MLCLPSGERIRLDESRLRLLFEVEDLAAASPATVSRCVGRSSVKIKECVCLAPVLWHWPANALSTSVR